MKGIMKIIKKFFVIGLVILLNLECFASIISDNDGAAFITKYEFEALKNSFVSQINNYNNSIDEKIDGAIASYLAGLMIEKVTPIEPSISNYNEIRWMNGPYMYFTNRKFTEYTTTAGRYTDRTEWQVINPENRRQCQQDGYLWWFDKLLSGNFSEQTISFMLHPYDVSWAWGTGRNVSQSRGPSIFAVMEEEKNGWAVYAKDGGIVGERGHGSSVFTRPHVAEAFSHNAEQHGGVNYSTVLQHSFSNNSLSIDGESLDENEIADYNVRGIIVNSKNTTTSGNRAIRSIVRQDWNPGIFTSSFANLWAYGDGGFALKVACGYQDFMGQYYSRIGNSLVEDNRWATERQYKSDRDNFIYSMWGRDVSSLGDTNVAPPIVDADFKYIDLSKSPNKVTIPFKVLNIGITAQNSYLDLDVFHLGNFQTNTASNDSLGEFTLTFPLFYRVNWADMLSGEFKYHGASLCKSDGFPIAENIEQSGEIKLIIKYVEKTSSDPSVVIVSPDQKIKTYIKNKPFTDPTGSFYKGYTNLKATGTDVELNGIEWTDNEMKFIIPVKKNDSIWLRIDPLTADGVYCEMTDIQCTLVTE